jgi:hypothetical protein
MGRPLNKKYFGNRNIGSASVTTDNGIGGSRVGSVTVAGTNNSTGYLTGEAVTFSTPDLPGGVTATGTVVATAGAIVSITIVEAGSGYTSVPTATAATGVIGTTTLTAVLQADTGAVGSVTNQENAIKMTAYLTGGSAVAVDIRKQVSTNRFKVTDGTRTGIVKLKSSVATAAGEGSVRLVDSVGGTYFATKITARKATVTRGSGTAFATGAAVKWNMTAAVLGDSLLIDNA